MLSKKTNRMTLTNDQNKAVKEALSSVQFRDHFLLSGSAGVGKTTALKEIAYNLDRVKLTAPTHQAAMVIADKTNMGASTIHNHLKLVLRRDGQGGYKLVPDYKNKKEPEKNTTIICDEASMIGSIVFKYISLDIRVNRNTYLFVGDKKQLNPVEEPNSVVFTKGFNEFELTEILRQASGNDNVHLSRNLGWLEEKRNGNFFHWTSKKDALKAICDEGYKLLTWTNDTVEKTNQYVRNQFYSQPREFEVGEYVIFGSNNGSGLKNGETFRIMSCELREKVYKYDNKEFIVEYWHINNQVNIVKKSSRYIYSSLLKKVGYLCDNQLASWDEFYDIKENYSKIQHSYASTVHKAQGSTYENCVVNVSELNQRKSGNKDEWKRLLYTAITRTANENLLV